MDPGRIDIKHCYAFVSHAETNGQVEAANTVFLDVLKKRVDVLEET